VEEEDNLKDISYAGDKKIITAQEAMPVNNAVTLQPMKSGEFAGIAWQLPDNHAFYAGVDSEGRKVLVPVKELGGK